MLANTEPVLSGTKDDVIANNWNRHVPVKVISQILGVSKLTIYRRAAAMNLPTRGTWNEDNEQILRELWADGQSAKEIGAVLGMTRNAVIGKKSRMGITRDGETATAVKKFRRKRNRKPAVAGQRKRHNDGSPLPPLHIPDDQDDLKATGITLLELKDDSCRAVLRQVRFGHYLYCGKTVVHDQSYCAGHCARFHAPPRTSADRGPHFRPTPFRK